MSSLAKRRGASLSDGFGGQNWKRKLTMGNTSGRGLAEVACWLGQVMEGAAGGAGLVQEGAERFGGDTRPVSG